MQTIFFLVMALCSVACALAINCIKAEGQWDKGLGLVLCSIAAAGKCLLYLEDRTPITWAAALFAFGALLCAFNAIRLQYIRRRHEDVDQTQINSRSLSSREGRC